MNLFKTNGSYLTPAEGYPRRRREDITIAEPVIVYNLSKQPAGLKLTSMSGEQTYYEATELGSTRRKRTIALQAIKNGDSLNNTVERALALFVSDNDY